MGKTSKRSYRSIVESNKVCYPKAETVRPHHYTYTIGPTKTYRLKDKREVRPIDMWPVLILFLAACMFTATVIISLF